MIRPHQRMQGRRASVQQYSNERLHYGYHAVYEGHNLVIYWSVFRSVCVGIAHLPANCNYSNTIKSTKEFEAQTDRLGYVVYAHTEKLLLSLLIRELLVIILFFV